MPAETASALPGPADTDADNQDVGHRPATESRADGAARPVEVPAEVSGPEGGGVHDGGGEAGAAPPPPGWVQSPSEATAANVDPLLSCLLTLTRHYANPISPAALTSGLPLEDGNLTPGLFVRAAARAGLSSRLVRRSLDGLSKMVLPAILLLKDRRACVVTGRPGDDTFEVIVPEAGDGVAKIGRAELAEDYEGYALFVRPEYRFDGRTDHLTKAKRGSWFWGTVSQFWPTYAEVVLAAFLINLLALASPLFVMNVYDRVVPNQAIPTLWVLAAGIGIAFFFDFLLKSLRSALIDNAGKRADVLLASRIFEQVMNIQMKARPPTTGAFANQLREFETVRDFFTSATLATITDLLFIGVFVFVIYSIGGWLAWIPALAVPVVIIIGLLVQIPLNQAVKASSQEAAQKHAILVETVSSLDTIKSLGAEGRMQRAWERFVGLTARTSQKSRFWSSLAVNLSGFAQQSVSVVIVIFGVYRIANGDMSMGALVACTILGGRSVAPLAGVANTLSRFHQSRVALRNLDSLMALPVERPADRHFVSRPVQDGRIEYRNVHLSYTEGGEPALRDVSFKVEPGEKVGLIGRIGCGKTSLARTLIGLYTPDQGSVLLDDVDLRQYHPTDIRRGVGSVMQDVQLFFGTVKENIAIGFPYADDAMILRAAKVAGVDDFVSTHPQGYDMQVGERGQNLSGGQRQSIALARAMLTAPPILMLDEPTSAMDTTSELQLMRRLSEIAKSGVTLMITTHRPSLLRLVDRVIVLDHGRVVMDGTRDDVIKALQSNRGQTK